MIDIFGRELDADKLSKLLAKAHLHGYSEGDVHLIEYIAGIAGSFWTGFFELYVKADHWNKQKLADAFPEEAEAFNNWQEDINYFDKISNKNQPTVLTKEHN